MKLKIRLTLCLSIAICGNVIAQIPSYIPKDSLVGWWPFNGNAKDESGNGNHGIVNGASLTTDRNGNSISAYIFDGSNDNIQVPNSSTISITNDITMSAWVQTSGNNNKNYQTIISKRGTYWTWEYNLSLSYHNNVIHNTKIIASRALGKGNQEQAWSTTSYSSNWEHWVTTISNNQIKIYKNGILDKSQTFNLKPINENCPLLFGQNLLLDTSEQFYGKLDDIAIWNRALDSNEVKTIYKECSSKILIEPSDCGKFNGNASFKFHVSDTTSKYQWQINQGTGWTNLNNAGQFSGTTLDSLIIKNITLSNDGQLFRCISTSNCGKNTSREAKLSVWGVNTNSIIKQAFTLSPNPVKDILNIQGVQNTANYQITNAIGQTCLQGKFTKKLDVSSLKPGVYFFKTETGTQRFVKE